MKLSKRTIDILKSFSAINQGIVIEKGNVIKTVSDTKTVFGEAKVEKFPQEFAIYDLANFLSIFTESEEPEVDFKEKFLTVKDEKMKASTRYFYSDKDCIVYPKKSFSPPEPEYKFKIEEKQLKQIAKMANVMQLEDFVIKSDGEKMTAGVLNYQNDASHSYFIDLGKAPKGAEFDIYLKQSNMKFLPLDYDITVSEAIGERNTRVATFNNEDEDLSYHIALEDKSTFGDND